MIPSSSFRKLLPLLAAAAVLLAVVFTATAGGAPAGTTLSYAELPDPMERGPYKDQIETKDPLKLGTTTFQEPNYENKAATGANSSITAEVRGVMYRPKTYPGKSPLILIVHGNHGSCDKGSGPACEIFKRNDEGYAYLGENLASWGYTVVSLDQDELMARQDNLGKGMHNRRLLIQAMLERLKAASEGIVSPGADATVAPLLDGKLDMTRIGLMGHSRGGDAVSSFVEYDHTLPVGERFPLRAVISLAPVDYERHAPYGVPFMTVFGSCDGDVSNLQGARLYERSQYMGDPYPRYQVEQIGGNHNAYNTVWQADADDASASDVACGPDASGGKGTASVEKNPTEEPGVVTPEANVNGTLTANLHSIRLSGEAGPHFEAVGGETKPYRWGNGTLSEPTVNKLDPAINTRISGDPALMGDQEKLGLATMAAFFRRYVGGEGAFEPYLTGELAAEGKPSIPMSACPASDAGKRIPCIDRVADSYMAPESERLDVIRPDTEHPTTTSALGAKIEAVGFANPYPKKAGGVTPRPATTANGIDWCNPDPRQAEPAQLNEAAYPTSSKPCPAPALEALGGQAGTREKAPVNGSYGRQLSVAWEEPVENTGAPATLSTMIPGVDRNVSGFQALYLSAAVNFFDPRNPARGEEGLWNPETAPQNFTIAVTDAEGHEGTVEAGDPRYGTALQQTLGSTSARVHVILHDIRVPLADFAAQGVDLSKVSSLSLRFGEAGMPQSGSVQLADLRFQQPVGDSGILLDSTAPNAGPGEGPPASGPNPVAEMEAGVYRRADVAFEIPNRTMVPGASVLTVDDDGAQCPNAQYERIQEAIDAASPWDTIVVCPGVYAEASTPVNSTMSPVQSGATNGLTINKPLKIIGAGASKVTIKPAASLGSTLAGTEPYLRDGGGNVITVSRQSLGSTEYDESYVDISGVTIESPSAYVEAGVAFFNSSGRIANSVVGPLKRVSSAGELTTKPYGWGIVATNSMQGAGSGAPERQVTVVGSKVYGYQSGGIRFDDARGADAAASTTEPSGMKEVGFVKNTLVEGSGASTVIPQTGIQYHAGASGQITESTITNNLFPTEQRKSVGVLLTGAGSFGISGSKIVGNGYGLFNADVKNEAVREGAPAEATGNYWGTTGGSPVLGPTVVVKTEVTPPTKPATYTYPTLAEGVSGADAASNPSVLTASPLGSAPATPTVGIQGDVAPVGEIVNPADGEGVEAGLAAEPVVLAEDDYGIKSVTLTADGLPVAGRTEAPYAFAWTPTVAEVGSSVTLVAKITDSSGQVTTSQVTVPVVTSAVEIAGKEAEKVAAKEAEEKAAATKAGEEALKSAEAKAEAAAKEAKEAKELAEKAGKSPVSTGKVAKDTSKGTARLSVIIPSPGQLVVTGSGIKKVSGHPTAPGQVQVLIAAKGKALTTLNKKGKVTVTVQITFTTADGTKEKATTTVTLVKK